MASERQVPTFHTGASRWSHAIFMPVAARTVSRHPPNFVPGQRLEPGFGDIPTLSTLHQRFTRVRLTSSHLTGNPRLFHNARHPGHWARAACGGLDPGPATRARGAFPHLLCSKVLKVSTATSSEPPLRTVVAHNHQQSQPATNVRGKFLLRVILRTNLPMGPTGDEDSEALQSEAGHG